MKSVVLGLLVAFALAFGTSQAADAAASGCGVTGDLHEMSDGCARSGSQSNDEIAQHPEHSYEVRFVCALGGQSVCSESTPCSVDGDEGTLYEVYEDGRLLDWRACLTDGEAKQLGAITPAMVAHEFRRLSWPASRLIIQPPKGRTLVNFDTNFYTTNVDPTRQTITLLGHSVTIEAIPADYVWQFDPPEYDSEEEPELTTGDPGAPYPDLRVTHRYLHAGTAHPRVDTIYTGRYRVGGGAWHDIPDTLTVEGAPQSLRILTATPHLVG